MNAMSQRPPVKPGEVAPNFRLPAVHRNDDVSLADYRGQVVFLAIFLGLWCPFCRRNIADLGFVREQLLACRIETLAVVATDVENARLYFKYRPTRVPITSDPDLITHRAYGLPRPHVDDTLMNVMAETYINPTGELPAPVPATEIGDILDRVQNYQRTSADSRDLEKQWPMLRGQFLVDGEGILRWVNIECAKEGLAGIGRFPTVDEILAATQELNLPQ
jgi:peroxiredoxin